MNPKPNILITVFLVLLASVVVADENTEYASVNKVLTKYCAGCHNADDSNGDFALHDFDSLLKGGESGKAITPGSAASSRLAQMMLGKFDPVMPPEDEAQPSDDEIQVVIDWIESGAAGPSGEAELMTTIDVPAIQSNVEKHPVTALAISKSNDRLAVASFKSILVQDLPERKTFTTISDVPGKVTSLQFFDNGKMLLAGTGVAGLFGEALLINVETGEIVRKFKGHRDLVYSVAISEDEKWMATAGYDRKAVLWDIQSDEPAGEFLGHNDAIFDCRFDSKAELLITASADGTVKVWRTSDGMRLDTRSEPLKEQYSLALSGDGKSFFAAGEDNRIRKWELVSRGPNQTNPLELSRFADESAIQLLRLHPDGEQIVSVSSEGPIKVWDAESLQELYRFETQTFSVQAIAVGKTAVYVGAIDGSVKRLDWPSEDWSKNIDLSSLAINDHNEENNKLKGPGNLVESESPTDESEPNDSIADSTLVEIPVLQKGTIFADDRTDVDLYRVKAKQGEEFVITVRGQNKSPIDSKIVVLDSHGKPVPRVLLQAVRDSYFTFRGKNSNQTGDFRIHNWEEMQLNQMLYCNGEVVRLYHYPRGPDSGFNVFPNFGKRHTMFDTTPITHALQEPCYIVKAYPPGTQLPGGGLPQFLLNYENDDDGEQELGKDSRLTFKAPADGEYIVKVSDSRDFQGDDYHYELSIMPSRPSFKIKKLSGENPKLIRGAYKRLDLEVDRVDGFSGPITVTIDDLPPGVIANSPITVEAGELRCSFTLFAAEEAPNPAKDAMQPTVSATAQIRGKQIRQTKSIGSITLENAPKLTVELVHADKTMPHFNDKRLPVIEIKPGETIRAKVKISRRGYNGRVNFGKESAALNLPFGVYVDNTGLNGVLITPEDTERTFFLTAEPWLEPSERLIFLEAQEAGKPSSNPAVLRVIANTPKKLAEK